jgi:hypothetical protein
MYICMLHLAFMYHIMLASLYHRLHLYLLGGETWTDPLGGDPSGCRLIGGDRDLRA